jgi:hypothetical protein
MYETEIHGRKVRMWGLYPQQVALMCALNQVMVEAIPTYGADVCTEPGVIDFKNFSGAMAHYNVSRKKVDIGTVPMAQLDHFMRTGQMPEFGMAA